MPTQIQLRRGTTSEHSSFTGAAGELTVDTTKKALVVHDGATAGGIPVARDSTVVHTTGAETVAGVKTLSSNPVLDAGTANGVVYLNGSKSATSGSALVFDGSNLGLGVTPSAWSGFKAFDIGSVGGIASEGGGTFLTKNAYDSTGSGGWKYKTTSSAALYLQQAGGAHAWYTAASGNANDPITFTQALTLDANRNLLLNGTSAGASAVGTLAIFNGTAPTGSITNGIILYAEDVSSSSELKVRDEAGNVTTLSPHNFSLIPDGPSEDMAWAYYSEKGGKRINVDMLKLARMVEKLTGEKLVYES